MRDKLLPALFVALLLIFLQLRSGADSSFVVVVAATAILAYVVIASGRMLLVAAGVHDSDPSGTYVMGLIATCLGVYALTVMFPLTAGAAFGVVAAIVIGLELAFARRYRGRPADWRALIGFALCVAFTAAWCSGPAGAYEIVRTQGVLPVWGDHFIHGARISQFGDVRALGRGSIFLADFPPSFYHFASYLAAAPLAGMLDQPGLPLATSAWLPLGFLAMTTGAYALGERLSGAAGGVAALAAIAVLPDASNYGLRNGLLSFHWSVLAHPSATYALGAAFLSLALLDRWSRERSTAALLASGALAVSLLYFRMHVFLLYLPAWVATVAYCRAQESSYKRRAAVMLVAAVGATAAAASLMLAHLAQTDPSAHWRFGGPALIRFLEALHGGHEPTAYTGLYAEVVKWYPSEFSLAVGIVLAALAALGAFAALLPAAAILARRCGELRPIDVFPAFVAYCWLLLMLFAPVTWAIEGPELIDRPVVLLYASATIWTACLLLRCLATRAGRWRGRVWPATLAGSLVALPATLTGAESMARPKFRSGEPHLALRAEPGLVEAAAFLRKQALVGDIFAVGRLNTDFTVIDLPAIVCALSGVPAYLARPHLEMIKDAPRKEVAAARLAALKEIDQQAEYREAIELLRRLHVQWYFVADGQGPRWDPRRERAAFSAGTVSLYATSKLRPHTDTSP